MSLLLRIPKLIILGLLRFYKTCISPLLPPACRFTPTCSAYTTEAVQRHGVIKGLTMGTIRICKCQPFHPGGYDPVPANWRFRDLFTRRPAAPCSHGDTSPPGDGDSPDSAA